MAQMVLCNSGPFYNLYIYFAFTAIQSLSSSLLWIKLKHYFFIKTAPQGGARDFIHLAIYY